jgi:hypothetical protein
MRVVPSKSVPSGFVRPLQSIGRPTVQYSQRPQFGRRMKTQRSPGATVVTPGPTASTTPHPS